MVEESRTKRFKKKSKSFKNLLTNQQNNIIIVNVVERLQNKLSSEYKAISSMLQCTNPRPMKRKFLLDVNQIVQVLYNCPYNSILGVAGIRCIV